MLPFYSASQTYVETSFQRFTPGVTQDKAWEMQLSGASISKKLL